MPRILPIMRIPPGVRSRLSRLKLPTASLCAIAGVVIAWPNGLFPGNLVPIPSSIAAIGDGILAKCVSKGSVYLLETAGLFLPFRGGLLHVGNSTFDVTLASGGLRVLLAVFAFSTAAAALQSKPVWERLFIIGSGFPVAILCGVFRVTAGCLLFAASSQWLAELVLFEISGWLTLAFAWGFLLAERSLLSRLLIPPPAREVVPVFRSSGVLAADANRSEVADSFEITPQSKTALLDSNHEFSRATSTEQPARQAELILGTAT